MTQDNKIIEIVEEPAPIENYIVSVVDRREPDGTFTKVVSIGLLASDGKAPNEPDQVGMVQQQKMNGWTYNTIEAIAELFYKQNKDAVDRDAPEPIEDDLPPEEPRIIASTTIPKNFSK